jgi:flagellum-specific peptidoglycan hydrolase FlgJ
MSVYQHPKYKVREQERSAARQKHQSEAVSQSARTTISLPTLQEVLHRLGIGIQKLITALRFRFHQLTAGQLSGLHLPWFKMALAAIAFFILTQKNIQFSINMRSPLSGFSDDREAEGQTEQMSLAQPISFKNQPSVTPAPDLHKVKAYIQRFAKIAKAEQDRYGIPASLKMAQAILESQAGHSATVRERHNHFGAPLANRVFDSAWENWRAHSLLLVRYFPDLSEQKASAVEWAAALQQSDLVSDKNYANKLTATIRQFDLDELD